jgi:hypothetical protein
MCPSTHLGAQRLNDHQFGQGGATLALAISYPNNWSGHGRVVPEATEAYDAQTSDQIPEFLSGLV